MRNTLPSNATVDPPAHGRPRGRAALPRLLLGPTARSSGWLFAESVATLCVNTAVAIWTARHLGVADYGTLSWAVALVGLFGFLTYLGLDGLVTKALVEDPEGVDEIVGTALALRLLGGTAGVACVGAVLLRGGPAPEASVVGMVVAPILVIDAFLCLDFPFQARQENRYPALARLSSVLLGAGLRVALILTGAPLLAFAAAVVVQRGAAAVGMATLYRRRVAAMTRWRYRPSRALALVRRSWPLALSSAGALLYLKVDQVMLGHFSDAETVGVYAVAARLSEVWYFLPSLFAASLFPTLVRSRNAGAPEYERTVQASLTALAWVAIALAVGVTFTADPLVRLLFGPGFEAAAGVLRVHIWACPAVFMGALLSKWLLAEDLLGFSVRRHLLGAAVNVAGNAWLIPLYGATGAAYATVVSYTVASFLACFTDRRTRPMGSMMARALVLRVGPAAS